MHNMPHEDFTYLMQSNLARGEICDKMMTDSVAHSKLNKDEVMDFMKYSDKELFRDFKENKITMP